MFIFYSFTIQKSNLQNSKQLKIRRVYSCMKAHLLQYVSSLVESAYQESFLPALQFSET